MTQTVEAIFEDGVFRPMNEPKGIAEHTRVRLVVETSSEHVGRLPDCFGIMSDEDADEIRRIVEEAFENVDPNDWR
jgi:predicted DNA-binding antitoxin AbrB/MazE fold protein